MPRMPRRPWSGTRIPGHMRTSSTSTIIRHMPMEAYRSTGNARCSTATQRPSFRWVLPQGRLELSARVNSITMSTSPTTPAPLLLSLSLPTRSLLTGPTIVISQPAQQRRPTWAQPTSVIHQSVWRQRRDSLSRAPLSPVTIRPPTPRQVGSAPSPRHTRAQVSVPQRCYRRLLGRSQFLYRSALQVATLVKFVVQLAC